MTTTPATRPALGAARPWTFPAATTWTAGHGLQSARIDLPGQELLAATVALDLPLSVEPEELEGVATIMARTLDEGSHHRDAEEFARRIDACGASYRVAVDLAGIRVQVCSPARTFGEALELLAEAVTAPAFAADEVDRHVQLRLGELAQARVTAAPRAQRELRRLLFAPDSRASRPTGGSAESVARIDAGQVAGFWSRWVHPTRTTLVLAGAPEALGERAPALVAEAFGDWTGTGTPPPGEPVTPRSAEPGVVLVHRPGAVQSQVLFGVPIPDRRDPAWPDLTVAAHVLGGGLTSRLMALLREEKGYTYGVHAFAEPMRRGGVFQVNTAVEAGSTGEAVADTLRVLGDFSAGGMTAQERDAAVDYRVGIEPLRHQTAEQVAGTAAACLLNDLGLDHPTRFSRALAAVEADGAVATFRRLVPVERLGLVVVGDADRVRDEVAAAAGRPVEVIEL